MLVKIIPNLNNMISVIVSLKPDRTVVSCLVSSCVFFFHSEFHTIMGGGGTGSDIRAPKNQISDPPKNQISDITAKIRYQISGLSPVFFRVRNALYQLIWMINKKVLSRYTEYLCLFAFKWRT